MNEAQNNTTQAQADESTVKRAKLPKWVKFAYYPALIVVAVVLIIVSFVTYYYAGASTSTSVNTEKAYGYATELASSERNSVTNVAGKDETTADAAATKIKEYLNGLGIESSAARKDKEKNPDGSDVTNKSEDQKITADFVDGKVTYTFMDMSVLGFVLDRDTVSDMTGGDDIGKEGLVYSRPVKNFVIAIPGSNAGKGDAIVIMTHYDSLFGSKGAVSASAVGAVLGTVEALKEQKFTNDVVFVLTDGRYENSVGAYAFKNQFVGFGDVYSRTKAVFNFDAITAGGALTAVQTTDGDGGVMGGYIKSKTGVRLDSSVAGLLENGYTSDFDAFYDKINDEWEVTGIDFAFTAGKYDAGTKADDINNVSENAVAQYASAMEGLAKYFGNADLSALVPNEGTDVSAYTYMGVSYATSAGWVYAMAAMLLILLGVELAIAVKKKAFGMKSMFKGVVGVLLTLALSLAAFFVAYFIIGMLTVAFGAATMNMLTMAHFLTPAVLIPAMLFAAAVSCGLYPLFKRALKVKAADCVRGGALLQIVTAICFGFIAPTAALPYLIIGLVNGAVMLLTTLLKDVYKKKTGFGIERLFLYTIPTIIGIPFFVQSIMTINNLFPIVTMPFLLVAFALTLTSITPYFDYLKPVLSDAYEKLPAHTIRVVESVSEDVEDAAKKGKFKTVTETKVLKQKVKWRYHNWFGVTVLCVLTSLILLITAPVSAAVNNNTNRNLTTAYDYSVTDNFDVIYDNGIVCYIDASYSNPESFVWEIKDEWIYKNIRGFSSDFDYYNWEWDENKGVYRTATSHEIHPTNMPDYNLQISDVSDADINAYAVRPVYGDKSQVKLEITGIKSGDTLTVSGNMDELVDEPAYSITFSDPADKITVVLPNDYADKYFRVVKSNGEENSDLRITAYEYMSDTLGQLILNDTNETYREIKEYFKTEFGEDITVSCVIVKKN